MGFQSNNLENKRESALFPGRAARPQLMLANVANAPLALAACDVIRRMNVHARDTLDRHPPNIDLLNKWLIIFVKRVSFLWKHPHVFNPVKLLACS